MKYLLSALLSLTLVTGYAAYRDVDLLWAVQGGGVVPRVVVKESKPPVPGDGFHVLIVEQTEDRGELPESQKTGMMSTPLRRLVMNNGGTFHLWDADIDASRESKWFRDAMKLPMDSLPWLVVSNGKTGFSGPLPATAGAIEAEVRRHLP